MVNSLLLIFDEIWLKTLYYSTVSLTRFWSNFKNFFKNPNLIRMSSKFLHSISTYIYASEKNIKTVNSLLLIFDEIWPKTLYRVFDPIFEQL